VYGGSSMPRARATGVQTRRFQLSQSCSRQALRLGVGKIRPASGLPQRIRPFEQVAAECAQQVHRARRSPGLLSGDQLAVDVLLVDQQGALSHVAPLERERLLRAQARVGQNGDESGVASSIAPDERLTNGLDLNG